MTPEYQVPIGPIKHEYDFSIEHWSIKTEHQIRINSMKPEYHIYVYVFIDWIDEIWILFTSWLSETWISYLSIESIKPEYFTPIDSMKPENEFILIDSMTHGYQITMKPKYDLPINWMKPEYQIAIHWPNERWTNMAAGWCLWNQFL